MNDWFESPVSIDARSAAIIASGMRAVARADGVLHQRELSLIAAFEAEIPAGTVVGGKLEGTEATQAFVRSLIMTALADGVISDAEMTCIGELCADQGIDRTQLDAETLMVKRKFLSVFAGVNLFRESVLRVAKDLGLSESELDALAQDA
jgi:uncharacterized membrane protein YebE (DUF533 family)